ncbi:hypothetical protein PVL29_003776 [Vitis rotundifolia]|uniref:Uncharacterized protein n=1 Tax=Vitis rotundifolia TaxID=103349 RepID=A0AA39E3I9_VITRO|nr:hypothetical protein PVL29_003776 [Vitis rotundifolia]
MIQLPFTIIFAEMALIMILFKTPLRKLVIIMALDRVRRGRGPIAAQTVAGTVFVAYVQRLQYDEDPEPCYQTRFD